MPSKARLVKFARDYGHQRGFSFGEGADSDIQRMAEHAVNEFKKKFDTSGKRRRVEEPFLRMAEQQLAFFIEAMILAREEVYDAKRMGENILGEDTYAKARAWVCPLWPFC